MLTQVRPCDFITPPKHGAATVLVTILCLLGGSPARAQVPAAAATTCPTSNAESIAARLLPSIVMVEGPGGAARGFVIGSDRLVAAPLAVVEAGRGILVRGPSGEARHATVKVADPDHGLALLELPTSLPGSRPLETATTPLTLGATVFAFSAPLVDGAADMVLPGVVTRIAGDTFNASARLSFHPSWGSPLVDCAGGVVGMAATFGGDEVVRAAVLPALVERAPSEPEYSSGWSLAHPSTGLLLAYGSGGAWLGASLGTSLVGDDRYELSVRGELFAYLEPATRNSALQVEDTALRVDADVRVAYRFLLNEGFAPVYLVPSVGVVGGWERWWRNETIAQVTGSDCSPSSPCPVEQVDARRVLGDRARVAPVFGAALRLTPLEIGYSLELDVNEPLGSTHTLLFGLQL